MRHSLFLLTVFCIISSCRQKEINVQSWLSTADQTKNLSRQKDIAFSATANSDDSISYSINVEEDSVYQKWIGCGACTNDASAWLMYKKLKPAVKDSLMHQLFNKNEGIGLDWIRHQMGSGDAAVINGGWWTYDDMPKGKVDPGLSHFSIEPEYDYIIPMLKEALKINPDLKIIGCPWTPPVWMKTSSRDTAGHNAYTYGQIRPEFYASYANYFVKFIQAYQAKGIPVYGISIQNEPLSEPGIKNWQGCKISADTAVKIFAEYIGPAFSKNKITTKLYCYDHNWDEGVDYVSKIYNHRKAGDLISGSMWHHYAGLPKAMTTAHALFPNKEIWFSEGCATTWHSENYVDFKNSKGSFMNFAWNVINVPRNWCQTMMMYQIALDTAHGPAVFTPATNFGMITVNQSNGQIEYRPEYFTLGHISKFVYPNAYRIKSNQYDGDIESVAFKNPDHSIVLLLSNRTTLSKRVKVKMGRKQLTYFLPGESLVTLKWTNKL